VFAFLGRAEPGDDYGIALMLPESSEQTLSLGCCEADRGMGSAARNWVTIEVAAEDCPPLEVGLDWIEESYRTIAPKTLVRGL
jgi:hypothetical protein